MQLQHITDAILQEATSARGTVEVNVHDVVLWISCNRPREYAADLNVALREDGDPFLILNAAVGLRLTALPGMVRQIFKRWVPMTLRGEKRSCEVWHRGAVQESPESSSRPQQPMPEDDLGPLRTTTKLPPKLENLRRALICAAAQEDVFTYGDAADILGITTERSRELSLALGEISRFEHQHGRPLLTVVVGHKEDLKPGDGFFIMAKELGVQQRHQDNDLFFIEELRRAHTYWRRRQDELPEMDEEVEYGVPSADRPHDAAEPFCTLIRLARSKKSEARMMVLYSHEAPQFGKGARQELYVETRAIPKPIPDRIAIVVYRLCPPTGDPRKRVYTLRLDQVFPGTAARFSEVTDGGIGRSVGDVYFAEGLFPDRQIPDECFLEVNFQPVRRRGDDVLDAP